MTAAPSPCFVTRSVVGTPGVSQLSVTSRPMLMRFYNRRLVRLADLRQSVGLYGANNLDNRYLLKPGFSPGAAALKPFAKGLWAWWKCELQGVRHRFLPRQKGGVGASATGATELSSTL